MSHLTKFERVQIGPNDCVLLFCWSETDHRVLSAGIRMILVVCQVTFYAQCRLRGFQLPALSLSVLPTFVSWPDANRLNAERTQSNESLEPFFSVRQNTSRSFQVNLTRLGTRSLLSTSPVKAAFLQGVSFLFGLLPNDKFMTISLSSASLFMAS